MKLIGITRVRNEAGIIRNTLDHVAGFVDKIFVYDDASEDSTFEICLSHKAVSRIFSNDIWDPTPAGRARAEGTHRQKLYEAAVEDGADWVYCFDADEYLETFKLDWSADAYYFRLFDFYITEEDSHLPDEGYLKRKWMGPEYRDIPMLFKVGPKLKFTQRVPRGIGPDMRWGGFVKHYGKAISVLEWEKTCIYYTDIRWRDRMPELRKRWESRKGKAVHTVSDFGNELITWEDKMNDKVICNIP